MKASSKQLLFTWLLFSILGLSIQDAKAQCAAAQQVERITPTIEFRNFNANNSSTYISPITNITPSTGTDGGLGWTGSGPGGVYAYPGGVQFLDDNVQDQRISRTITDANLMGNKAVITLLLYPNDGTGDPNSKASTLKVIYNNVTYVTFATLNGPTINATVTAANGATVSTNTIPANGSVFTSVTITLPATIPNTGTLSFRFDSNAPGGGGDDFTIRTVSFQSCGIIVAGNVLNDNNGTTGGVNGTAIGGPGSASGQLYVNLVDGAGLVVATAAVAADGSYSLLAPKSGAFTAKVATTQGTVGSAAPAAGLPSGWSSVSESDNSPDLSTAVTINNAANNVNITGTNFGINQPPTVTADVISAQTPGSAATVPNVLANDTDPNGGTISPGTIDLYSYGPYTNLVTGTNGVVTGFTRPGEGTWAVNPNTGAVTFTPQAGFTGDPTPIGYRLKDAAGLSSALTTITIDYNAPVTVSGTVFNDNNAGTPDGTVMAGVTVDLYVNNGGFITSTTTDANGNYSFPNLVPGSYATRITTPSGYQIVGATDNNTDVWQVLTVGSANITGVNYGINQPPVPVADAISAQTPGSAATVPNILANDSDPNGGTLSAGKIDLYSYLPASNIVYDANGRVTSFTVAGEGAWALNTSTGAVTFTPQAGFFGDPTAIAYRVTDAAGLTSPLVGISIDYNPPATISGTVFNDNNAGTPDGTVMAGITVDLYVNNGGFITTTTTDANGNYSFPNLAPGSYATRITTPSGYQIVGATDNNTDVWQVLTVGSANITGVNYGINQPPVPVADAISAQTPGSAATVPNILANDSDPNGGTLSAGKIDLYSYLPASNIVHDANGRVTSFTVAGEGAWALNTSTGAVTFTPQAGFFGDPTAIAYRVTDAAGLTSPLVGISIDYNPPATISGTVFNDNNAGTPDGTRVAGVTVELFVYYGGFITSTTTDASGNYSFPNLVPGSYATRIITPAGYQLVGSTDNNRTDGWQDVVNVGSTNVSGINYGINQAPTATADVISGQTPGSAATITNILSNDTDPNSGTLSADKIALIAPAGATGVVTTNGRVTGFTVPNEGIWALNTSTGAVTFTPQSGFLSDPTPIRYKVTDAAGLTSNEATITIDYNAPATISGTVFNDNNAGTPDGTVMAGVTVDLYVNNGGFITSTTTDANGNYSFPNLVPGSYATRITTPSGYQIVGATDNNTDVWQVLTVGSANITGVNYGINQPPVPVADAISAQTPGSAATVPNILANDSDPNGGTLSAGKIDLYSYLPASNIVHDANGRVTSFTVAGEGAWALNTSTGAVTFTPQTGFLGDPTAIAYRVTDAAGLTSPLVGISVDYNPPATISGTVFNDNNAGTPDGTAMAGTTVDLYVYNGGFITTTTTDANGNYSFPNLVPGSYATRITTPSGYQIVSETDNSNDIWQVLTVGSANITGVNYGLNQPPTATNDSVVNQAAGTTVTVPNILSNDTDPNSGALSAVKIGLVTPSGATNVATSNGLVTGFTVPNQGAWALNTSTGAVTFTPQSGFLSDPAPIRYKVTDAAGLTSNEATIKIDYNPVTDLTPVILLPVNAMNTGDTRNFVVRLNEINNVSTTGQIAFNISVPAGYTLTFTDTLSSTNVVASGTYTVSNSQWNTFNVTSRNIDMQSKPGFVINANSRTYIGFKITRISSGSSSVSNISVNIYPDNTRRYDSNNSNNLYHRVITGN